MKKIFLLGLSLLTLGLFNSCSKENESGIADDTPLSVREVKVTSFEPIQGKPGTLLTIQGEDFSTTKGVHVVKIGGIRATVLSLAEKTLTVRVPEEVNSGKISVTIANSTGVSEDTFTVIKSPKTVKIGNFEPKSGKPGTTVVIDGWNFGSTKEANGVKFGEVSAEVKVVSENRIKAKVPEGATTDKITVYANGSSYTTQEAFVVE